MISVCSECNQMFLAAVTFLLFSRAYYNVTDTLAELCESREL